MKKIKLTQGKYALVDDVDFEWLNSFKWYAYFNGYKWYVQGHNKRKTIKIHREIIGCKNKKLHVDHIDGNPLNNQRKNLRVCTPSQNGMNRGKQVNNTSGFKGVSRHIKAGKWQASIKINKRLIYLGIFETIKEAKKAYEKAAKKLHGEFRKIK